MFKPWIGREYKSTRLLLLGESAYSWEENARIQAPSPEHSEMLVRLAIGNFETCVRDNPFMALLSRGLAGERSPGRERLQFVWDRVAFTNYVPDVVGIGPRVRPTGAQWQKAHDEFPAILNCTTPPPERMIVLGKSMWTTMPQPNVKITEELQAYRNSIGELCWCWAIHHPSRGLAWEKFAEILHFTYRAELQGP